MAGRVAEVQQPPLGEHDDRVAVREAPLVDLGLDVHPLHAGRLRQAGHVDLVVEVSDVADDRLVLHRLHVCGGDHVAVARRGDEDVGRADDILQRATWKPSIAACSAQIGSISVTITRAPWPRSDSAQPLPTSPYPQTTATLPPISTSVARLMPSISEWRQPYLLSNFDFVTESLTLIAGKSSVALCGELVQAMHPGRRLLGHALDLRRRCSSTAADPPRASAAASSSTIRNSSECS